MTKEELIEELKEFGFKVNIDKEGYSTIYTPQNKNTNIKLLSDKLLYNITDDKGYNLGVLVFNYNIIKTKAIKTIGTFCISTLHSDINACTSINLYKF